MVPLNGSIDASVRRSTRVLQAVKGLRLRGGLWCVFQYHGIKEKT